MSDDVITLDSSDEEPSPITAQEPIADQIRRKYKQINIESVKPKEKVITQQNNKSVIVKNVTNNFPRVKGPSSSSSNMFPIKGLSMVGNTQIKKTAAPPKVAVLKKQPQKTNIPILPSPVSPNINVLPMNINGKLNKINTTVNIKQSISKPSCPAMPVIVQATSLAKNVITIKNNKVKKQNNNSVQNVQVPHALKIRNITNTQSNIDPKTISSNITIKRGGMVVANNQFLSANSSSSNSNAKRSGGNVSMPPQKKQKIVLNSPMKRAVDSVVRKVAKEQCINLDGNKSSEDVIPTVEIDDDEDDEAVTSKEISSEIPIEYDPDNSKENEELIEVPPSDPLGLEVEDTSVTENYIDSVLPLSMEVEEDISNAVVEKKLTEPRVEVGTSDILSLNESIGTVSSKSIISVISNRDSDDNDCVEETNDSATVLSKCDFYTPKKKDLHNDGDGLHNVSRNMSEEFKDLPVKVDGGNVPYGEKAEKKIMAVPVRVTVNLSPQDRKKVDDFQRDKTKKRVSLLQLDKPNEKSTGETSSEPRQFTNTYQRFIDLCLSIDPSEDMKKIIEKKVKSYYMSVYPSFAESKSFTKLIEGKIKDIKENPGSMFLYIKDVVDELKVRRTKKDGAIVFSEREKSPKRSSKKRNSEDSKKCSDDESSDGSDDEGCYDEVEDEVMKSRIRKLERAMRKLNKAIKKLQEREVDCDDENSAYLLEDRYKARLLRIYQKLCELTGERNEALSRRSHALKGLSRLTLCGGRFPKLVSAVKTAANSRPHWFPDYVDVLKCVEHCAKEQGLNLRQDELHREAREAFVEIGTLLQKKRREAEFNDFTCMLGSNNDPADEDSKLAEALEKNREISKNREMEIINKFVEKQYNLKLVPEDVPDGDADKSEGSDDESGDEGEGSKSGESNEKEGDNTNKTEVTNKAEVDIEGSKKTSEATSKNSGGVSKDETNKDNNNDRTIEEIDSTFDKKSVTIETSVILESKSVKVDTKDGFVNESVEKTRVQVKDVEIVDAVVELHENDDDTKNLSESDTKNVSASSKDMDDEEKSNCSSLSLVDLISSDSRDSFNSGVEADTEDSKPCRRFKKLKTVRPSSVLSGLDLLNEDSVSMDTRTRKDSVILAMDVDESTEEVNSTVIEKENSDIIDNDNAVDKDMLTQGDNRISTTEENAAVASVSSSDVLSVDEAEKQSETDTVTSKLNNKQTHRSTENESSSNPEFIDETADEDCEATIVNSESNLNVDDSKYIEDAANDSTDLTLVDNEAQSNLISDVGDGLGCVMISECMSLRVDDANIPTPDCNTDLGMYDNIIIEESDVL